jgi:hypothetical protein
MAFLLWFHAVGIIVALKIGGGVCIFVANLAIFAL